MTNTIKKSYYRTYDIIRTVESYQLDKKIKKMATTKNTDKWIITFKNRVNINKRNILILKEFSHDIGIINMSIFISCFIFLLLSIYVKSIQSTISVDVLIVLITLFFLLCVSQIYILITALYISESINILTNKK